MQTRHVFAARVCLHEWCETNFHNGAISFASSCHHFWGHLTHVAYSHVVNTPQSTVSRLRFHGREL